MADAHSMPQRASARKSVPQRVRFDVFKRDSFTCQYCGAKAPDVVLQCDHIEPVAAGGTGDILNLITSCAPCNGGKGAVPLSDVTALDRQRGELADLEERRQQIDMMLRWRDELQSLKHDTVAAIVARIDEHGQPYTPAEEHCAKIKRWLSRFSVAEILSGVDASFEGYADYKDGKITIESWKKAFFKIPAVVSVQRQDRERPDLKQLFYIRAIIRNRTGATVDVEYLEHLVENGWDLDFLEVEAKRQDNIKHFAGPFDDILLSINRPYGGRGWR